MFPGYALDPPSSCYPTSSLIVLLLLSGVIRLILVPHLPTLVLDLACFYSSFTVFSMRWLSSDISDISSSSLSMIIFVFFPLICFGADKLAGECFYFPPNDAVYLLPDEDFLLELFLEAWSNLSKKLEESARGIEALLLPGWSFEEENEFYSWYVISSFWFFLASEVELLG